MRSLCCRRTLRLVGLLLCLGGALLGGLLVLSADVYRLAQQAEEYYRSGQYDAAAGTYQQALARSSTFAIRLATRLLGRALQPARLALQRANSRYRLAEAALRPYQQAARQGEAPRPSLTQVQSLLMAARQAYGEVPRSDPYAYVVAQINAARVEAWQLLLAAFAEQTPGRQSLKQQLLQTIEDAAQAVDLSYTYGHHLTRQEQMTAILLLETLTASAQEGGSAARPSSSSAFSGRLGDLLRQDTPELSPQERARFQQFFFAMPLEARDPWALSGGGMAGAGSMRQAH